MNPPDDVSEAVSNLDIGPFHEHIVASDWDRIFIIGDVHGCLAELKSLLDTIALSQEDLGLFVGDLLRKGPDSNGVLDLIQSRPNLRSVRGNNEQKIIEGETGLNLDAAALSYLETLPLAISVGEVLVVHGGVDPRKTFAEQTPPDLLEARSLADGGGYERPFWFERYAGPPRIAFGHTVFDEPYLSQWAVGLDTGCVHGGRLSAYGIADGSVQSVPAETVHEHRSKETIVSPGTLAGSQGG